MSHKFLGLIALAALAACAPAAPAAPDMAAMSAVSKDIGAAYMKAYAAKDAEAIANLYTEDAIDTGSDTTALVGRAAIKAAVAADFAQQTAGSSPTLTIEGDAVMGTADFVVTEGTYSLSFPLPAGPFVMHGGWMAVSTHQADGSWKMHRLITNLSSAARPPMPPPPVAK